jgi:hypothetical protein
MTAAISSYRLTRQPAGLQSSFFTPCRDEIIAWSLHICTIVLKLRGQTNCLAAYRLAA